jgi:uncharacterized HAD superfamily protein
MIIGVDVDGVLANWSDAFQRRMIRVINEDRFPPSFIPNVWDWPELFYTPDEVARVWNAVKGDRNFWADLEPYYNEKVIQSLDHLRTHVAHGDDVYFITSRVGYKAKQQTETWLLHHGFGPHATVLISSEKGRCAHALKLNLYIDDQLENVMGVAVRAPQCDTYLIDRPWNRNVDPRTSAVWTIPHVKRAASLHDVLVSLHL